MHTYTNIQQAVQKKNAETSNKANKIVTSKQVQVRNVWKLWQTLSVGPRALMTSTNPSAVIALESFRKKGWKKHLSDLGFPEFNQKAKKINLSGMFMQPGHGSDRNVGFEALAIHVASIVSL